jgi:hypothetical protein
LPLASSVMLLVEDAPSLRTVACNVPDMVNPLIRTEC